MRHDTLSDALSVIQTAEKIGRQTCIIPDSNTVSLVLEVVKRGGYIDEFKHSGRDAIVTLLGKINIIRSIRPRFTVRLNEFEKFENRYLPSRDIGIIVVSTSKGVMSHKEAKEKMIGGRLLAYVY